MTFWGMNIEIQLRIHWAIDVSPKFPPVMGEPVFKTLPFVGSLIRPIWNMPHRRRYVNLDTLHQIFLGIAQGQNMRLGMA